jgi:HAD superfamily hydrolase (TIGR01509 family)
MIADWHKYKTETYKQMVREGKLPGRPGVRRLIQEAKDAGWLLAVASTSAEESVRGVLEYVVGKELFGSFLILAGDVVPKKKPAPDIYLLALEKLGVSADKSLIIEDSRNGLLAAVAAGVRCIVTLSSYTWEEEMGESLMVVSDLGEPGSPMKVVANRSNARPGEFMTLKDLEACLGS